MALWALEREMGQGTYREDHKVLKHWFKKSPKRSNGVFYGCLSRSRKGKAVAAFSAIYPSSTQARRCQIFLSTGHQAGKSTPSPTAAEIWKTTSRNGRASTPCWDLPHNHQSCSWSCSACSRNRDLNDTCHSQPGVPAPSNALSACKNIYLE